MVSLWFCEIRTDCLKAFIFCNFESAYFRKVTFSLYQNYSVLQNYCHFLLPLFFVSLTSQCVAVDLYRLFRSILRINMYEIFRSLCVKYFISQWTKRYRNPVAFEIANNQFPEKNCFRQLIKLLKILEL